MPFPFKLSNRFTTTKFNDQGKRPRAETVQVEDVIASLGMAMGGAESTTTTTGGEDSLAKTTAIQHGGEKRSQREADIIPHLVSSYSSSSSASSVSTYSSSCGASSSSPSISSTISSSPLTPEQEQRDMVQNIAARVLAMQRPDQDLADAEIPSSKATFMGTRVPAISFVKYVERLVHNINRWAHEKPGMDSVGVLSGVFAIEYLERSCAEITPRSIHRYFLAAFLVGIKYCFDYYLSNTYWAGVGGIRLPELNTLEMEFCCQLGWDFGVSAEAFEIQFHKTKFFYV